MMEEGPLHLGKPFLSGYAAWQAAPGSPPTLSFDLFQPVRTSASAYCGPGRGTGNLDMPGEACSRQLYEKTKQQIFHSLGSNIANSSEWQIVTYIDHSI